MHAIWAKKKRFPEEITLAFEENSSVRMFDWIKVGVIQHIQIITLFMITQNTWVCSSANMTHFVDCIRQKNRAERVPTLKIILTVNLDNSIINNWIPIPVYLLSASIRSSLRNLFCFSKKRFPFATKGPDKATVFFCISVVSLTVTVSVSVYHPPYLNSKNNLYPLTSDQPVKNCKS